MAPSWLPKSIKNRFKIDAKIDRFFDASWGRFLRGFWWILGSKMEPSWHQNRSKIDANCEVRFFEKSCSRCSGGSIFEILGVEVGRKNRLKIDQKTESKMECILASIFDRFWWILEGKLGWKLEPRSTQKGIEKRCEKEEQRDCQKSRNKKTQPRATGRVLGPGEVPRFRVG